LAITSIVKSSLYHSVLSSSISFSETVFITDFVENDRLYIVSLTFNVLTILSTSNAQTFLLREIHL
jgi:hypothetical protein